VGEPVEFAFDIAADLVHADTGDVGDFLMEHPFRVMEDFFVGNMQTFFLQAQRFAAVMQGTEYSENLLGLRSLQNSAVNHTALSVVLDPFGLAVRHMLQKEGEGFGGHDRPHPAAQLRIVERDKNGGSLVINRTEYIVLARLSVEAVFFDGRYSAHPVCSVKYRVVDLICHNTIPISGNSGFKADGVSVRSVQFSTL